MLNGKKSIYIDFNNFLDKINEENFNSGSEFNEIPDAIRYYSKNFWTTKDNQAVVASEIDSSNVLFKINHVDDTTIELIANKNKFIDNIVNERGILEEKFNHKSWDIFLKNKIPNVNSIFEDYYILSDDLTSIAGLNTADPNIKYINREFKYNFYSEKYERLSADRTIDPTTLPSMFSLLENKKSGVLTREQNIALTLGGLVNQNYVESLFVSRDYNVIKKYFDEYSEKYILPDARTVINEISYANFNISSYYDNNKITKNTNFIPFPYYCDVNFYNIAKNKDNLIHYMNSVGKLVPDLLKHILEETENVEEKRYLFVSDVPQKATITQYDFKVWIDKELTGLLNLGTADGARYFNENSRIYSQIEYTNLIDYVKNNIKPKNRKYKEYMKKSSDSHVLIYKIEKRQFNSNSNVIQTFWLLPDTGDNIRFIDTQIKYGIEYYYTITAYTLIVGNEYHYEQTYYTDEKAKIYDLSQGRYKLKVINKPTYKILELKLGEFTGAVHERPLTKPKITFQKDRDSLRINLLQSAPSSLEEFEIIENRDFNLFESIKRSQENNEVDKIFSTDKRDDVVGLQIYRTTSKPISYLSLQGKLYKTLTINNEKSFVDSITPNIKYWYAFRYLNNHDTPSNVSDVYEVEMKNEDGYSYIDISILDLKRGAEKSLFKNMKRYLLIRPSVIQTQPKMPETINSINDVSLGPKNGSVWDKDFIIRLTSKKTNRVLEFNLKSIINRKKE